MNDPEAIIRQIDQEVGASSCSCKVCVEMCETRPCWGTPQEIRLIMDAGFSNRLMRDYWSGSARSDDGVGGDVDMVQPAIVGYEGESAPFWPSGRCTFLTDDGLCELHNPGLKPFEGRMAKHSEENKDALHKLGIHRAVAATWESDEGRALFSEWDNRKEG